MRDNNWKTMYSKNEYYQKCMLNIKKIIMYHKYYLVSVLILTCAYKIFIKYFMRKICEIDTQGTDVNVNAINIFPRFYKI